MLSWALLIIGILIAGFALGAVVGAPFLPTRLKQSQTALGLLNLKPGQTVLDLGSGNGSFLRAAASAGLQGIGYEINPLLVLWSKLATWRYRRLITIKWGNYWNRPLPLADGIYVFLITKYMPKLDAKLSQELVKTTKVASYAFKIPNRPILMEENGVYLYNYEINR